MKQHKTQCECHCALTARGSGIEADQGFLRLTTGRDLI